MPKENPVNKPDQSKKPPKPSSSPPAAPPPSDEARGGNSVMLKTALRLGLRDINGVQEYENLLDAKVTDHREQRKREIEERTAKYEAERMRLLKEMMDKDLAERMKKLAEAEERSRRSRMSVQISHPVPVVVPPPPWKEYQHMPMTADFVKDLTFAEMAKTPQGIQMSMACLLHHEEVKNNAELREKMKAWLTKKLEAVAVEKYAPIMPLMLVNHIRVQRQPIPLDDSGEITTRLASYDILGFDKDKLYEAKTTRSRPSCLGLCGSKNPKEITIRSTSDNKFVMRLCLSHWNGILPEWADIMMPENERYGSIHSTTQMHTHVENNYDIFDNKGRVLGVASPEKRPISDLINVTMYDNDGNAVSAKIRGTNNVHGEYKIDCPIEMSCALKTILIGLIILLLVEDLGDYEGRGENGR